MRDILITAIVAASLPMTLKRPWIGVLMWVWISVMNPHRLSWGFAYNMPFAAAIAGATVLGLLTTRDPRQLQWKSPIVIMMIVFLGWMCLTTITSIFPEDSLDMLNRVWKIFLMTLVTMMLIKTQQQVRYFVWTLVGSLGYYGVKGGIFTIKSAGADRVWGPEGTFIEGNNELALALIVIVPLMYWIYTDVENKWVKRGMAASMGLSMLAALGSYSRGALLALAAVVGFLWLKSKHKAKLGVAMLFVLPMLIMFMPSKWGQRMDTIETYQEDASAMGRINAWHMAFNMASDRIMGGGFEIYSPITFAQYAPNPTDIHAAHSIYFQAMGEHGFIGLAIYLTLAVLVWRRASWIIRNARARPDFQWASSLAAMIQVSMVGFAVGGAFLSLLYFDVPYYLMAVVVVVGELLQKVIDREAADAEIARRKRLEQAAEEEMRLATDGA